MAGAGNIAVVFLKTCWNSKMATGHPFYLVSTKRSG